MAHIRSRITLLSAILLWFGNIAFAAAPPTTTTLSATNGDSNFNGTSTPLKAITLTAKVQGPGGYMSKGFVKFCDASAPACADIHLLGTGTVLAGGVASIKIVPGLGQHSYKAIFAGTAEGASSASAPVSVTVAGKVPTNVALTYTGDPGTYTLSATLTGSNKGQTPTGTISFVDTDHGNTVLGTVPVPALKSTFGFTTVTAFTKGTFDPTKPYYPFANGIQAYADFNEDGIPDLYTTDSNGDGETVLLGKGDGTFLRNWDPSNPPGYSTQAVVAGDFDNDGHADVFRASTASGTLFLYSGDGKGNLTRGNSLASYHNIELVADDFDQDGALDYAYTHYSSSGSPSTYIDVAFSSRTGASLFSGNSSTKLLSGDFDGDGWPDLAVNVYSSTSGVLAIFLNNKDRTFRRLPDLPVSAVLGILTTGDYNGDGKLDIAVVNSKSNLLSILFGNGDGTFAIQSPISIPQNVTTVTSGDFDGDGKLDLAVGSYPNGLPTSTIAQEAFVTSFLGKGDGTFVAGPQVSIGSIDGITGGPLGLFGQDLNGDGLTDLFVVAPTATVTTVLSQYSYSANVSLSASPVKTGTHQIAAVYSGDANFLTGTSTSVTLTGSAPTVALAARDTTLAVKPGANASTTLQITSVRGFIGTAHLTCQVDGPSGSTTTVAANLMPVCSLSPQDLAMTSSASLGASVTITTSAPTTTSSVPASRSWPLGKEKGGIVVAALFFLFPLYRSRKRIAGSVALTVLVLVSLAGCGKSGQTTTTVSNASPGTPVGSYTVTLTATGPADSVALQVGLTVSQ